MNTLQLHIWRGFKKLMEDSEMFKFHLCMRCLNIWIFCAIVHSEATWLSPQLFVISSLPAFRDLFVVLYIAHMLHVKFRDGIEAVFLPVCDLCFHFSMISLQEKRSHSSTKDILSSSSVTDFCASHIGNFLCSVVLKTYASWSVKLIVWRFFCI